VLSGLGDFGNVRQVEFCPSAVDCGLDVSVLSSDAVLGGDGSIMITATNGQEPYMYSIDGGDTFQTNSVFPNLSIGDYDVVVMDATDNCIYEETVTVSGTSATDDVLPVDKIVVSPNPSNGLFSIEISSQNITALEMYMDVIDVNGKIVQSRLITKYNNVFKGTVSLVDYPVGSYYITVNNNEFKAMSLMIKQ